MPFEQFHNNRHFGLRILSTTDLHGHILGYNYADDCVAPGTGLAGVATLIKELRQQTKHSTLLVDNGDFLQGTAFADHLAKNDVSDQHPIAGAFNILKYDAVGIGNHDFDFGLPYLRAVAGVLNMPTVCSNLYGREMGPIQPSTMIERTVHPLSGDTDPKSIKIGILSFLPQQTRVWNHYELGPRAWIENSTKRVAAQATALREDGADIIIALVHMGPGHFSITPENTEGGIALAQTGAIDAIVAGHSHQSLPGLDFQDRLGVDAQNGRMGDVPAVMAGHAGSDLGVLDLALEQSETGKWRVTSHKADLRPNTLQTPQDPALVALAQPTHDVVRAALAQKISTTDRHIHSYFAMAHPGCTTRRVAAAQLHLIQRELSKSSYAELPLLSAAPAQLSGGRNGPEHYFHIQKGPIFRRHIAALAPYTNRVVGLRVTGREINDWLEHAATSFSQLVPHLPDQPLLNETVPTFHFDTIYGIDYAFDLTAPVGNRVRKLRWQGKPIAEDQPFAIATTLFRAAGGGGYVNFTSDRIICQSSEDLVDALIDSANGCEKGTWAGHKPWHFCPLKDTQAILNTAPTAMAHLKDIAHLSPENCGQTEDGFLKLRLTL